MALTRPRALPPCLSVKLTPRPGTQATFLQREPERGRPGAVGIAVGSSSAAGTP